MTRQINIGFVPLTDAAPIIVAHELGFAEEEGFSLSLVRERSWATIRDKLAFGVFDAAHILLPIALELPHSRGPTRTRIDVPLTLNMNGNSFVASSIVAERLAQAGAVFGNARSLGEAIIALGRERRLRIAVPFMQSMHVTMLRYLLRQLGHNPDEFVDFQVSPPSRIEQVLQAGDVDAFMVGAPWATNAVENGSGQLMLTSNSIWQGAPEKVLGIPHRWLETNRPDAEALVRALYRAGAWCAEATNAPVLSEILSRDIYVDVNATVIEQYLQGQIALNNRGHVAYDPLALQFDIKRIGFPWKSSAAWIAEQNAPYWGIDAATARDTARALCRTDVFRSALESIYAPMPYANEKLEGSLETQTAVPGRGEPMLGPDAFFDGSIYEIV